MLLTLIMDFQLPPVRTNSIKVRPSQIQARLSPGLVVFLSAFSSLINCLWKNVAYSYHGFSASSRLN